jgi:hypothetical protein
MAERHDSLPDEMDELELLFRSRGKWTGLSTQTEESSTNEFLIELLVLRRQGDLDIGYSVIPRAGMPDCRASGLTGYDWRMASFAQMRKGKDDLIEQMWAGFHYLQGRFPDAELEVSRHAPFFYIAREASFAITAGDLSVERTLKEVAYTPFRQLGVVAQYGTWSRDNANPGGGSLDLAVLSFSETGIEVLRETFERRRQRFAEKLGEARDGRSNGVASPEAAEYLQGLLGRLKGKGP